MAVVRIVGRVVAVVSGFALFVLGLVALGVTYLPDHDVARVAGRLTIRAGAALLGPFDLANDPRHVVAAALSGIAMRFLATPAGLILMVGALLPGSSKFSAQEIADGVTLAPDADAGRYQRYKF